MSAASELSATVRSEVGKTARSLSREGKLPAVLYGAGRDTLPLAIDRHEFELFTAHHSAGSTIVELKIEGQAKPVNAMLRQVQHSAIKGNVLHVDFQEVAMNKPIHAVIAVALVNDPAGVKAGGILTVNVHELNVEAKPSDLPDHIEVDVSELEVGASLHIKDITAPKGIALLDDPDMVVASVQAPRVEVEAAEAAEISEPEVIGSKSETEE